MFDLAIIGGGPAGIAAAIQANRFNINCIIVADDLGGKVKQAHSIENWLGEKSISGEDLDKKFTEHLKSLGIDIANETIQKIDTIDGCFLIRTNDESYKAKRIILATGNERNKLNIKGEDEFQKKGVSYKAAKEGKHYKEKVVAVVGSGDSACTSANYLAEIASKVYLMYRSPNLKAEPIWINKVQNNPKVKLMPEVLPTEILGNSSVSKLVCSNGETLDVEAVFVEIGFKPPQTLMADLKTDNEGFVEVDVNQKTNLENVWAAGDITTNSGKLRQIITAAAEGMVAINSIYKELNEL